MDCKKSIHGSPIKYGYEKRRNKPLRPLCADIGLGWRVVQDLWPHKPLLSNLFIAADIVNFS